jgi:hypothetical protein
VFLSHDLGLLLMDTLVSFSCIVWSPKPVDVKFLFRDCDLRKPGECDGQENFKQVGVSNSACSHTLFFGMLSVH